MGSFESVRQIVEKRFWDTYSSDNAKAHGAKVFVEGHDIIQPTKTLSNDGSPWIVLSVADAGSNIRAFGGDMRKTTGFVRFTIFTRHGTGTKIVREIADYIDSIVGFQSGVSSTENLGNLFTHAGQMRKLIDDDNGYLKYAIDFDYDYYQ
tara:strand:- start:185 stop:634 length:450 start_codon:yes stop_codon:yes gene_type:complete